MREILPDVLVEQQQEENMILDIQVEGHLPLDDDDDRLSGISEMSIIYIKY